MYTFLWVTLCAAKKKTQLVSIGVFTGSIAAHVSPVKMDLLGPCSVVYKQTKLKRKRTYLSSAFAEIDETKTQCNKNCFGM